MLSSKLGDDARILLFRLLKELRAEVIPFGAEHWVEAVAAFLRYGKGRHPAGLDFGDCMTYATAKLSGEPLLFLGDDLARTDLVLAVTWPGFAPRR